MKTKQRQIGTPQIPRAVVLASPQFDDLDGRFGSVKRLKRRANELFKQAKGQTPFTAERCKRVAYVEQSVQAIEHAAINGEAELDAVYVQKVQILEKLYSQLGIDPNAQPKDELKEYLASKSK